MEFNRNKSKFKTKDMVQTALLTALVFVSTSFINIKLPILSSGGLVHLGNVMLFIAAIIFGKQKGAIAGAVGMGLFDLSSGWALWAPFTFIIRGVMGYIVGSIAWSKGKNGSNFMINLLAILVSAIWMIAGYYISEIILYGNWVAPMASVPGNITQLVVGAVIGLPITEVIRKYIKYI
ncbi:thiamine precursor transporter HmpT [Clostridium saccharobutylicum]|uniref:ECF transporter S component n=1 Tax=Clostridium saccharobutylicum TaxID=169679 RepID=UPI000983CCB7|nr:ECF transporter S component [Clostridium saccharobutylicum]AQS08953.1 thiamine precursor transporter HmpT [Clostridium saccharobutylicum]MBC2438099.1 ECF transporter S component [Clostridium saccharobutylicum]NSB90616.1 putative membrane protein [Clostridium saccharobutylicum]NYC28696.1 putative membrane protein [Clostridium saccharobutylicum]OOM18924.1 thiamine precursor transporter HmpT [Clostridium saccharobutylicum]